MGAPHLPIGDVVICPSLGGSKEPILHTAYGLWRTFDLQMTGHTLIDGNNLLHAMHAHAPIPNVGRETLVRIVERWANRGDWRITLVFDGPSPQPAMARQMSSKRMDVLFAAPRSADDVIIEKLQHARYPLTVSVVTDDGAIAHEARRRRAAHIGCVAFIEALFSPDPTDGHDDMRGARSDVPPGPEKPESVSKEEVDRWVEFFDDDPSPLDEPQFG